MKAWLRQHDVIVGFYGMSGLATIIVALVHP
jgi:hypothetical protein